jgi:hypothetical protein
MCVAFYCCEQNLCARRNRKWRFWSKKSHEALTLRKEAAGNVSIGVVTFFQNAKLGCPEI